MNNFLSKLLVKLVNYFRRQKGDFINYGDLEYWQKNGFSIIPNHYYSPVPNLVSLDPKFFMSESKLPGVNMRVEKQIAFLKELSKYGKEMEPFTEITKKVDGQSDPSFYFGNMAFDNLDACIYYGIVRYLKPKKIIEVGSGWSTKIAAAAVLKNRNTELISIEPYPQPILKKGFPGFSKLIEKKIEDIPLSYFTGLKKGDILFIDSSHTVKVGGDVNYLFLEILPRLKKGVWVHVHDIFLPWEYPQRWVRQEYRFWAEQYLLRSFLIYNSHFEVIMANNFLANKEDKLIKSLFPFLKIIGGGSFWIRKIK